MAEELQTLVEHQQASDAPRGALLSYLEECAAQAKSRSGDIHDVVKQRQCEARQLRLPEVLTKLYEGLSGYPTFLERSDWERCGLCKVNNVRGEETDTGHRVIFTLHGTECQLRHIHKWVSAALRECSTI